MSDDGYIEESDALEGVAPPFVTTRLVGHQDVWDRLIRQLDADRLPGGILLHGPKGIGKATLAFALARQVLARTSGERPERVAELVRNHAHPNLLTLRKTLREGSKSANRFNAFIRVDEVRTLTHRMHMTRGEAGHRICIIDAAEDCNPQAANALLKMLEEPPAQSHFILVSHQPGRLLPTIRSRCQAHAMRPLSRGEMGEVLTHAGCEASEVEAALELGDGVPRAGFEVLGLSESEVLRSLRTWLGGSGATRSGHLALARALGESTDQALKQFAHKIILDHIAFTLKAYVTTGSGNTMRLASAGDLWNKANTLLNDSETYNLDPVETFVLLLEMIAEQL